MKTFEIDLNEALPALTSEDGFNEAIDSAFEEKYGEDYLQYSNAAWERENSEEPTIKITMEYKIAE